MAVAIAIAATATDGILLETLRSRRRRNVAFHSFAIGRVAPGGSCS